MTSSSTARLLVLLLLAATIFGASAQVAVAQTRPTIRVPRPARPSAPVATEFPGIGLPWIADRTAFEETTGRLLIANRTSGKVALVPVGKPAAIIERFVGTSLKDISRARIDGKNYWLALSGEQPVIQILNIDTLEPVRTIKLPEALSATLHAAADAPIAVVGTLDPKTNFDRRPFLVDLKTGVATPRLATRGNGDDDFKLSADASLLYGRGDTITPCGVRVWRVVRNGDAISLLQLVERHEDHKGYVLAPWLGVMAAGNQLYNNDGTAVLTKMVDGGTLGNVLVFHPKQPLVFSNLGSDIIVSSTNNWRRIAQTPQVFTASVIKDINRSIPGSSPYDYALPKLRTFIDLSGENLVQVVANRLVILPLAAMNIPDEPMLGMRIDLPQEVVAGQSMKFPITRLNPKSVIAIAEAPEGVKVQNDAFVWTPRMVDVGPVSITLKCTDRGVTRLQTINLQVVRPSFDLPFDVEVARLDPTDQIMVIAGRVDGVSPAMRGEASPTRIAAIDLKTGKVLASRELPKPIRSIVVSATHVFMASDSAMNIDMLLLKDLSDAGRVFAEGRIGSIALAGGELYASVGRENSMEGKSPVARFKLPELKPVEERPTPVQFRNFDQRGILLPQAVADTIVYSGAIYDREMKRVRMLFDVGSIPTIGMRREEDRSSGDRRWPFGMRISGTSVYRAGAQVVSNIPRGTDRFGANGAAILSDPPAAVFLSRETTRDDSGNREVSTTALYIRDLVGGDKLKVLTVTKGLVSRDLGRETEPKIVVGTRQLFVIAGRELYTVDFSECGIDGATLPLHVVTEQSTVAIDWEKPTTVTFKGAGGKGQLRYSLTDPVAGISIDTATGVVTVNTSEMQASLFNAVTMRLASALEYRRRPTPTTAPSTMPSATDQLRQLADGFRDVFANLAGRPLNGVPAAVQFEIAVTDSENQIAKQPAAILFDLPIAGVAAQWQADADKQSMEMKKSDTERQRMIEAQRQQQQQHAEGGDTAALKQRIAELERQNAELMGQVKMLKELLQGIGTAGPSTQPR